MSKAIYPVPGVCLGTAASGARYHDRPDIAVLALAKESSVAAVFTQNAFCAAPVHVARQHLEESIPRMLLINSGQANAGTGAQGIDDAKHCCQVLADLMAVQQSQVLPFSTGVIGEPLALDCITAALPQAIEDLSATNWAAAAHAILTTDTRCKLSSRQINIAGEQVTITGMTKGSGMIRPNMATMLAFVAMDVNVAQSVLRQCLAEAVNHSFNRITVDGDTSTNDACVLVATGQSNIPIIGNLYNPLLKVLQLAVNEVFEDLAKAIVRDGEGATKLVAIEVCEGNTSQECLDVAYSIAQSPLVKTALFAEDPNWGRILSAVGNAKIEHLVLDGVQIYLDHVCIVDAGQRVAHYNEENAAKVMQQEEYTIKVLLGRGDAKDHLWTCDLSYDYVKINAEYRS